MPLAVVATLTESLTTKPSIALSTYDLVARWLLAVGALEDVTFVNVGLSPVPNPNAVAASEAVVAPVPPLAMGKAPVTLVVKSMLPANWSFVIVPEVIWEAMTLALIELPRETVVPAITIALLDNLALAIEPANIEFVTVPYCKVPESVTCNIVLLLPFASFEREVSPLAYIISPAVYDVRFVPPLATGTVPPVITCPERLK